MDSESILNKIRSKYILRIIFKNLQKIKTLGILKFNKKLQNKINITKNDYKVNSEIEIELIPISNQSGKFINIDNKGNYYNEYYDENNNEIINNCLTENDKVSKIKIIIDYRVISCENLFKDCKIIQSINFKKFYKNNINNMNYMFSGCSSLKEINLSNFNTKNVTKMRFMFYECSSLTELDLSSFNTNNVNNMSGMFYDCSSLKKINFFKSNTNNLKDMSYMFYGCSKLKTLNLSNFNTSNVISMSHLFSGCSSLKEIDLSNFNTNNVLYINQMFFTRKIRTL